MYLSDKVIRHATLKDKPYKMSDGEGLYILIQPTGSKLWRFKYHFGGRERVLAIGKYPFISLAEAREHRYNAKKQLKEHIDPNEQKRQEKRLSLFDTDNSFHAIALAWFNANKVKWTPKHAQRIWRRLEIHAMHDLGSRPITKITTPDLVALILKLDKQGKQEVASRLSRMLHAIFRYGVHCGILESNPAADLKGIVVVPQATHFAAIHPSGLSELLMKLGTVKTTALNRIAMKLLLHCFVRPGELRYAKWVEIDWTNKQWIIPAERMKKRRQHVVPLTRQSIALLNDLKPISGYSDYLFPSQQRRRHPVMSENTLNKVLANMGYKNKQVAHGFRAIASTVLNESGEFRADVIEAQLAHVEESKSRKPYNRAEYLSERTDMMQWWSDYIEAAERK